MSTTPATERQLTFIEKLARQRNLKYDTNEVRKMGLDEASRLIDWLLKIPEPTPDPQQHVERGTYNYGGELYIIRKSKRTDRLYAARLRTYGNTVRTSYAPGVYAKLTPDMRVSLDEAKQFGLRFGVCCMCGRKLSDPASISAGIGPICAGRYF